MPIPILVGPIQEARRIVGLPSREHLLSDVRRQRLIPHHDVPQICVLLTSMPAGSQVLSQSNQGVLLPDSNGKAANSWPRKSIIARTLAETCRRDG
jgi:hypothetical protein